MGIFRSAQPPPADESGTAGQNELAAMAIERSGPALSVMRSQLADVVEQTADATVQVMQAARRADEDAEALAHLVTRVAERSEENAHRVVAAATSNASRVHDLVEIVTARDNAILELVGAVRQLDGYVAAISGIARATTVLALNAKIEASRAGDAGAGFSVVADEVRQLSHQSADAAQNISSGITRIVTMLEQHAGNGDPARGSAAITAQLHTIADAQNEVANLLGQTAETTREALTELNSSVGDLSERITAIVSQAQFQDITRQTVEHVTTAMDHLDVRLAVVVDHLRGKADETVLADAATALDEMYSTYASARQRDVHATTLTGYEHNEDTAPSIELF